MTYLGLGGNDSRVNGSSLHMADVSMTIDEVDGAEVSVTGTGENELEPPANYVQVTGFVETAKIGTLLWS